MQLAEEGWNEARSRPANCAAGGHGRRPGAANCRPVALREITTGFSAEFADRPFLDISPGQVSATLQVWTGDEHYHLRRLCSQGTRPRLSWAQRLMLPQDVGIPLLDRLFANPMRYITRCVANHVNDISKTDPHVALDTLERWRSLGLRGPRDMAM